MNDFLIILQLGLSKYALFAWTLSKRVFTYLFFSSISILPIINILAKKSLLSSLPSSNVPSGIFIYLDLQFCKTFLNFLIYVQQARKFYQLPMKTKVFKFILLFRHELCLAFFFNSYITCYFKHVQKES